MSEQTNEVVQHTGWGGQTTQIGVQNNHFGLTAKDAVQIAMELFREYFPQLVKECAEKVRQQLEAELGKIPPEQIQPPRAKIAVRALQNAVLSEEEELQAMYAKLLASDMNTEQQPNVHPAYVDILNQLSADEARILKFIASALESPTAEEQLTSKWIDSASSEVGRLGKLGKSLLVDIANKAGCNPHQNTELLFENLTRLGLFQLVPQDRQVFPEVAKVVARWDELSDEQRKSFSSHAEYINKTYPDLASLDGLGLPHETQKQTNLSGADLSGSDLSNTDLSGVDLSNAKMRNVNLRGALLGTPPPSRLTSILRAQATLTAYGKAFCDVCIPKE